MAMLWFLGGLQLVFAGRIAARLSRTAGGERIKISNVPSRQRVSILLPVLNERERVGRCLQSLILQPEEVLEILVVDGGSTDGTKAIAEQYRNRDGRVTLIDAAPVDPNWTGKAWGLHCGLRSADAAADWILCVDADASFAPELVRSLLNHAALTGVSNFSVATEQKLSGPGLALLHPALLTTLVYRFGVPGKSTTHVHEIQANGQCFFARRQTLRRTAAFETA